MTATPLVATSPGAVPAVRSVRAAPDRARTAVPRALLKRIDLDRGNVLRIRDGRGLQLTTASGVLWITEERSVNDTVRSPATRTGSATRASPWCSRTVAPASSWKSPPARRCRVAWSSRPPRAAPDASSHGAGARIAQIAAAAGGNVHFVGHSDGGAIALRVALHHPHLAASVAVYEPVAMRLLFDYNPKDRSASEVAEIARAIGRHLNGADVENAAWRFVDYWSGAGSWARLTPKRRDSFARGMPAIQAHFASLIRDTPSLHDYRGVAAPVLYMTGRETRASTRRIGELLRFALPEVEPVSFDAMGHLGPVTHAEIVGTTIARFVASHSALRSRAARKAA